MKLFPFFVLMQAARLIPLTAAMLRNRKLDSHYIPFVTLLALGFINETVNYLSIVLYGNNAISFNLFQLVECLLILYQFHVWGFFGKKSAYYLLTAAFLVFWIIQNIMFGQIHSFSPYFRIFYAFLLVLLIVTRIVYISTETRDPSQNAKFLICTGLIIFFIYQILFEGAYLVSTTRQALDSNIIIRYFGYMNVLVTLIYGWAVLVIPGPRQAQHAQRMLDKIMNNR